jgi:hypothetical protein
MFLPAVKRPGYEVDHSPVANAEVSRDLLSWCLIKHRDNFTVFRLLSCIVTRALWLGHLGR